MGRAFRNHGLQWPLSLPEVAALLIWIAITADFHLVSVQHVRTDWARWLLHGAFGVVALASLACAFVAAAIDPTDPLVLQKRRSGPDAEAPPAEAAPCYCTVCDCGVGRRSKHCRACNRCVGTFDHHCIWLNNCVGEKNYGVFFALLVLLSTQVVFAAVAAGAAFVQAFVADDAHAAALNEAAGYSGRVPRVAAICLSAATVVLCVAVGLLVGELLVLHSVLKWKRLTTFEFIIQERDRRIEALKNDPVALERARSNASRAPSSTAPASSLDATARSRKSAWRPGLGKVAPDEAVGGEDIVRPQPKVKVGLNPCAAGRLPQNTAGGKRRRGRKVGAVGGGEGSSGMEGGGVIMEGDEEGEKEGVERGRVEESRRTSERGAESAGTPSPVRPPPSRVTSGVEFVRRVHGVPANGAQMNGAQMNGAQANGEGHA
ncbi:unnamed protein product [Pedinophyceae sp. YPF-701]|nr:unnamed protein product [Pedinophyceae sp. YPF-701]